MDIFRQPRTGATSNAKNSVALGAGSLANIENTVSIGSDSIKRRVVNMADGVDTNDGVNVGQLNQTLNSAKSYTDTRINDLTGLGFNDIKQFGKELDTLNKRQDRLYDRTNAMGAMAAAMSASAANTRLNHCKDWRRCIGSFSGGIGYMEGELAGAIMYSRPLTKHGSFSLGAGVADGDVSSSIGIGFNY